MADVSLNCAILMYTAAELRRCAPRAAATAYKMLNYLVFFKCHFSLSPFFFCASLNSCVAFFFFFFFGLPPQRWLTLLQICPVWSAYDKLNEILKRSPFQSLQMDDDDDDSHHFERKKTFSYKWKEGVGGGGGKKRQFTWLSTAVMDPLLLIPPLSQRAAHLLHQCHWEACLSHSNSCENCNKLFLKPHQLIDLIWAAKARPGCHVFVANV